jgi:hypothetical protein
MHHGCYPGLIHAKAVIPTKPTQKAVIPNEVRNLSSIVDSPGIIRPATRIAFPQHPYSLYKSR